MITIDNYEEYMMMHADGELTPHEVQDLMDFIKRHPELEKELVAYQQLHFAPDASVVLIDKEKLIKPLPAKKVIAFPIWLKYSLAAGIALLIFIGAFKFGSNKKEGNELAVKDTMKSNITVQHNHPTTIPDEPVTPKLLPLVTNKKANKPQIDRTIKAIATAHKTIRHNAIIPHTENDINPKPLVAELTSLPIANVNNIHTEPDTRLVHGPKEIPELTIQTESKLANNILWNMLPMTEIKKKQLEHLAGALAEAYTDISSPDDGESDKAVSVKLHKRKLTISF